MKIIGYIESDFKEKFGIPRQSGLIKESKAKIVFTKEYQVPEAFRGLGDFSHIWVLWQFSKAVREEWSPTVRPPLLGGNKRMGVFATRSPFRPNNIGLSAVKLDKIDLKGEKGITLYISGADMLDGTPIYDIKPYLPYADSISDATGGFTDTLEKRHLEVVFPENMLSLIPENKRDTVIAILESDPRPSYQEDKDRVYGFIYGDNEIKFAVENGILTVKNVQTK